jgi:transcriptional regulator with XRE-family HTH domain
VQSKPTPIHSEAIYQQLGKVLRARREGLRLTQDDIARAVGLSRTSVTNIELGRQALLVHQLHKFAEALNADPRDLLSISSNDAKPLPENIPLNVSDLVLKILAKI